jgi:hypothetical protein
MAAPGPAEPRTRVFDVDAIRRVPGGIASHRVTLELLGPDRPGPDETERR